MRSPKVFKLESTVFIKLIKFKLIYFFTKQDLLNLPGGIPIVCAGSVFKSWNLIKPGFMNCLANPKYKMLRLKELRLIAVKEDSTIGAALLASRLLDQKSELNKHIDVKNTINTLDHVIITTQHNSYMNKKNDHIKNRCSIDNLNDSLLKEA